MGTTSNAIFTGNSQFSSDFSAAIEKAVALASMPQTMATNLKTTLSGEVSALQDLNSKFSALQSAVQSLQNATGIGSYGVSASDGTVTPSVTAGAIPGTYSIEVTDMGSASMSLSKAGTTKVTDPATQSLSSSGTYSLMVNGTPYSIQPTSNNLNALAYAINQATAANVHATVVNVGSNAAPDYRLSVQGTKMAGDTLQLQANGTDLLDTLSTGSPAKYKPNGLPTEIPSDTRTATLAPGVTVQFESQSPEGVATDVTVSRNTTQIQTALNAFASAYNTAMDALNQNRGKNGGPLSGDAIVYELTGQLRNLTSYNTASGTLDSLTSLGMEFDQTGHLSLNTDTLDQATSSDLEGVMNFLGDGTTSGFIKSATDLLNGIEDSGDGLIQNTITSLQGQITTQDNLITQNQNYVDNMKNSLTAQMSSADALVATMEQQILYMNGLMSQMQTNTQALTGL